MGGRFRDVVVVLDEARQLPARAAGLDRAETGGTRSPSPTTDFDTEANLKHRISEKIGAVQSVEVSGMSLRAVAKALMLNAVEAGIRTAMSEPAYAGSSPFRNFTTVKAVIRKDMRTLWPFATVLAVMML